MHLDPNPIEICRHCRLPKSEHRCGRNKTLVQLVCVICGTDFERTPSEIARGTSKFCGKTCYGQARRRTAEERFWNRTILVPSGCREWSGPRLPRGYGLVAFGDERWLTHRKAWELTHGPIPDGLDVCHTCDNPPCCEPSHLFLGTTLDNIADKIRKGRQARGEAIGGVRLTAEWVRRIRAELLLGTKRSELARAYGVHIGTIGVIARNQTWQHVS